MLLRQRLLRPMPRREIAQDEDAGDDERDDGEDAAREDGGDVRLRDALRQIGALGEIVALVALRVLDDLANLHHGGLDLLVGDIGVALDLPVLHLEEPGDLLLQLVDPRGLGRRRRGQHVE